KATSGILFPQACASPARSAMRSMWSVGPGVCEPNWNCASSCRLRHLPGPINPPPDGRILRLGSAPRLPRSDRMIYNLDFLKTEDTICPRWRRLLKNDAARRTGWPDDRTGVKGYTVLKRDDFSSSRRHALGYRWSIIFAENRCLPPIKSGAGFF